MKILSWFKSNKKANKAGQRGASLVELAASTPLLFIMVSGVITSGDLLTQHPWAAQTAYQLVDVLASNSPETAERIMNHRLDQLVEERDHRFARLELTRESPEGIQDAVFNGNYYGQLNNSQVVGVRFRASIRTVWNTSIPTPIRIDVVAPLLAQPASVAGLQDFSDPSAVGLPQFDCCGVRCDAGGNCSGTEANECFAGGNFSGCAAGDSFNS